MTAYLFHFLILTVLGEVLHAQAARASVRVTILQNSDHESLKTLVMPPSMVLKELFDGHSNGEEITESAAKKVLLSFEETQFWFAHLQTVMENRRRGAAKAALTRQRKKLEKLSQLKSNQAGTEDDDSECQCGTCKEKYGMSESPFWIFCDTCQVWFCSTCEELSSEPKSTTYSCNKCSS